MPDRVLLEQGADRLGRDLDGDDESIDVGDGPLLLEDDPLVEAGELLRIGREALVGPDAVERHLAIRLGDGAVLQPHVGDPLVGLRQAFRTPSGSARSGGADH